MPRSEVKRCPGCGERFECKAMRGTPCDCTEIRLSESALSALRERYSDCLCAACLRAVAASGDLSAQTNRGAG